MLLVSTAKSETFTTEDIERVAGSIANTCPSDKSQICPVAGSVAVLPVPAMARCLKSTPVWRKYADPILKGVIRVKRYYKYIALVIRGYTIRNGQLCELNRLHDPVVLC